MVEVKSYFHALKASCTKKKDYVMHIQLGHIFYCGSRISYRSGMLSKRSTLKILSKLNLLIHYQCLTGKKDISQLKMCKSHMSLGNKKC